MTMKKIPCEVWSRVVGYYQAVNHWNKGKQEEFADRKEYSVSKSLTAEVNYE